VGAVTFLFTDIEGSTALLQRLGDNDYTLLLAAHHALIRAALAAHGGEEVDTQGDAFFAVFDSPRACGAAALEMQQKLAAHTWPCGALVKVRMGMHTGEATRTDAGWVGLDVHLAARIAAVGYGGQVVVSEATATIVRNGLPPGAALADLGLHRLKDLGHPERIYQLSAAGLESEFPPLRSLGNPALLNNLPTELSSFIGRERELAELRDLLSSSRLVTLTGAGGSGKTRLGLQMAAELLDGSGDGVWLVELAAVTDASAVAQAICEALRIQITPGHPAVDALVDALAPQDMLVVLDNCEHLLGACAKIADRLLRHCPKAHLICTSREPIGISGETIYRVPSMAMPRLDNSGPLEVFDALTLFVTRAQSQGISLPLDERTGPLVVSICRQLDGLPLAIELASARLRTMSLTELHDRLDQRFRLLTGGSRTALERQQTLRATIGWSYVLLKPDEQTLLRRLTVFAETFDLRAVEAVCTLGDLDALDIADMVGSLVDKSLLVAEQSGPELRYRLLETIRQYAAEKLAEENGQVAASVYAAHSNHFLTAVEIAALHLKGPEQVTWLVRVDADYPNIRRAMEYAANSPERTAQVLCFGIGLQRYVQMRRHHREAVVGLLLRGLDRSDARSELKLFDAALIAAASSAPLIDMATTSRLAEEALQIARQLNDERLIIQSLTGLASAHGFAGDAERARAMGSESVERARKLGDDVLLAESLLPYLEYSEGAEWDTTFVEAISSTQRSGDLYIRGVLHHYASYRAAKDRDYRTARIHLEEAARILQAISPHPALVFTNMGFLAREEGNLDQAELELERVLPMHRRNGDYVGCAYTILGLACISSDKGDWLRAAELHGSAHVLLERRGVQWNEMGTRCRTESLARISAHVGAEQSRIAQDRGAALSFDEAIELASTSS